MSQFTASVLEICPDEIGHFLDILHPLVWDDIWTPLHPFLLNFTRCAKKPHLPARSESV